MAATVAATYVLPIHVWVANEVLGTATPTFIGNVAAEVLTARPTGRSDGVEPPDLPGVPQDELVDTDAPWTTNYAGMPIQPAQAIKRVGLILTVDPARPLGEVAHTDGTDEHAISTAAAYAIESWFDGVRTWIEVLTNQDLDHRHPVYDAQSIGGGFVSWRDNEWNDTGFRLTTPRPRPVTLPMWIEILRRVGNGVRPPLEDVLARDARAAYIRGDARKTVLDAATAVEVMLARLYSIEAPKLAAPGTTVKQVRMLGPLTTWLTANYPPLGLSAAELKQLTDARNATIHAGAPVSWTVATAILETTFKIIELHGQLIGI